LREAEQPPDILNKIAIRRQGSIKFSLRWRPLLKRAPVCLGDGGQGMPLEHISQAEGFVFVALVTLTVIAILDLILPRSKG
jgi:hypothetical protein